MALRLQPARGHQRAHGRGPRGDLLRPHLHVQDGRPAIPQHVIDVYVDQLRDLDALRASFEYYRTLDTSAEHILRRRDAGPLSIPVLAIGGQHSTGSMPEETMRMVATDVTGLVIPGAGHFLPEETPEELGKAVLDFLR